MKKKAIKIAASTAVAASAFVAAAPAHQADAASNVNQVVTDAQNAGTVLKWAISQEGTADYKTIPTAEYNAAKKALAAAEKAISGLAAADKLSAQAKLVDVKTQISRAMAYIDAITSGNKIIDKNATFNAAVASGDLDAVEKAYHVVTEEFRKQTILNYRVYGESTRTEILRLYKAPIEKSVREYANDVTVKMHLDKASALTKDGKIAEAAEQLAKATALLNLKDATFHWKKELEKSASDVAAALPLTPLSVSAVKGDDSKVVVELSKVPDSVAANHFVFVATKGNDVTVQSAKLEGKTVTLQTTGFTEDVEYTLYYKGEATKIKYQVNSTPNDAFVEAKKADLNVLASTSRAYSVKMTNTDGTPFTGEVTIKLNNTGSTQISSAELVKWSGKEATVNVGIDGVLDFVITNNGGYDEVKPTVKYSAGTEELSTTTFYPEASDNEYKLTIDANKDSYDKTNKILFSNQLQRAFKVQTNSLFYIEGRGADESAFANAVSHKDKITVNYVAKGISTFNITDNSNEVVSGVANGKITHEGSTYTAKGKANPGYTVYVFAKNDTSRSQILGKSVANSDGTFAVDVRSLANGTQEFTIVQVAPTGTISKGEVVDELTLYVGKYELASARLIDGGVAGSQNPTSSLAALVSQAEQAKAALTTVAQTANIDAATLATKSADPATTVVTGGKLVSDVQTAVVTNLYDKIIAAKDAPSATAGEKAFYNNNAVAIENLKTLSDSLTKTYGIAAGSDYKNLADAAKLSVSNVKNGLVTATTPATVTLVAKRIAAGLTPNDATLDGSTLVTGAVVTPADEAKAQLHLLNSVDFAKATADVKAASDLLKDIDTTYSQLVTVLGNLEAARVAQDTNAGTSVDETGLTNEITAAKDVVFKDSTNGAKPVINTLQQTVVTTANQAALVSALNAVVNAGTTVNPGTGADGRIGLGDTLVFDFTNFNALPNNDIKDVKKATITIQHGANKAELTVDSVNGRTVKVVDVKPVGNTTLPASFFNVTNSHVIVDVQGITNQDNLVLKAKTGGTTISK
ncbi:hypothetical protein [Bacillus sp. FJAT-22090]|uniref:hypothetical protein n=1 Tax=Bacillus sp. FJAT-22090 TaxID=1581038 RepID=UPI0011A328D3|nr:hypothetical protein [Bacillus sp. FJAT-22090]